MLLQRIAREYCPDDKFHDPITQNPVWLSCGTMDLALELIQLKNFALFKFEMGLAIRNSQAEVACKANQFCLTGGRRLVGQGASGVQARRQLAQGVSRRYWRAIDLAHINMASQRRIWLKPYLEVTVQRMTEEQGTFVSVAVSLMMMLVVILCVGCSPISEGGNPPAETPHAGAALAASSSASPPKGAAEVAGTAGQAKASSEPDVAVTAKHASPSRAGGRSDKAAEQGDQRGTKRQLDTAAPLAKATAPPTKARPSLFSSAQPKNTMSRRAKAKSQ
ncbi:hypothetical protein V8C86DRAFT_3033166, partial [Haematococcus lacustris]